MTVREVSAEERPRGRTRITPRALSRVVSAVAAEGLGVPVESVRVQLQDERGALAVNISTGAPVTQWRIPGAHRPAFQGPGASLLNRSEHARQLPRDRVAALTGSTVGSITIRFTGATMRPEARVR